MRVPSTHCVAATALLLGTLGCSARTMAKPDDQTVVAPKDTMRTTASDTSTAGNPSGYRGMERDTTQVPTGAPDSSARTVPGMSNQDSTSGMGAMDSTNRAAGMDTTRSDTSNAGR
jgi:hypothetical protein